MKQRARVRALAVAVAIAASATVGPGVGASQLPQDRLRDTDGAAPTANTGSPFVFAYYYIWYEQRSWRRAKSDMPTLGAYSSDDATVVADHVRWAKKAGIDAFIVSWKREARLDSALAVLVTEAQRQGLRLVLLYQGLDFDRNPLHAPRIAGDLEWFMRMYGKNPAFQVFGKPAIIWSGTWGYKDSEIALVRKAVHAPTDALLLGSEKSAQDYEQRADLFDGDAYYWSSVDPERTPRHRERLVELADVVAADGGRWIAPVSPGFDARLVGGQSVVPRRDGETFKESWDVSLATNPDALGIISWNEFSENSHIEPSRMYRNSYLNLTAELSTPLRAARGGGAGAQAPAAGATLPVESPEPGPIASPVAPASSRVNDGILSALAGGAILIVFVLLGTYVRSRKPRA